MRKLIYVLCVLIFCSNLFGQVQSFRKIRVDTVISFTPASFLLLLDSLRIASYIQADSVKIPPCPPTGTINLVPRGSLGYFIQYPNCSVRNLDSVGITVIDSGNFQKYGDTLTWDATRTWVLNLGYLTVNDSIRASGKTDSLVGFNKLLYQLITDTNTYDATRTWVISRGYLTEIDSNNFQKYPDTLTFDATKTWVNSQGYLTDIDSNNFQKYGDTLTWDATKSDLAAIPTSDFEWSLTGEAIKKDSLRFIQGSNVTLTQTDNTLTIAAAAGSDSVAKSYISDTTKSVAWANVQGEPTFLIPTDSTLIRNQSNTLYLKNVDSTSIRNYSNQLYEVPLTFSYPITRSVNTVGLGYNTTNLKLTANELNTIQDIATTSSPTFQNMYVTDSARIDGTTFVVSHNNNKVGIGTASPGYKLDVSGIWRSVGLNLIGADAGAAVDEGIQWIAAAGENTLSIKKYSGTTYKSLRIHTDDEIVFDAPGVIDPIQFNVRTGKITTIGNLGIGTTTPDSQLTVNQGASFGGSKLLINRSGNITKSNNIANEGMVGVQIDTIYRNSQSASIGISQIANSSPEGAYEIHYYISCITAGTGNVYVTFQWQNGTDADITQSSATLTLNATTAYVNGVIPIYHKTYEAVGVDYSTTYASTGTYRLAIWVKRIY